MFIEKPALPFEKRAPPLAQNIGSDKLHHAFCCHFRSSNPPKKNPRSLWRTHEHERVMHPNTSVSSENRKKYRGSKKSQTAPNLEFDRHSSISFLGEGDGESVNPELRRVSVSVFFSFCWKFCLKNPQRILFGDSDVLIPKNKVWLWRGSLNEKV